MLVRAAGALRGAAGLIIFPARSPRHRRGSRASPPTCRTPGDPQAAGRPHHSARCRGRSSRRRAEKRRVRHLAGTDHRQPNPRLRLGKVPGGIRCAPGGTAVRILPAKRARPRRWSIRPPRSARKGRPPRRDARRTPHRLRISGRYLPGRVVALLLPAPSRVPPSCRGSGCGRLPHRGSRASHSGRRTHCPLHLGRASAPSFRDLESTVTQGYPGAVHGLEGRPPWPPPFRRPPCWGQRPTGRESQFE